MNTNTQATREEVLIAAWRLLQYWDLYPGHVICFRDDEAVPDSWRKLEGRRLDARTIREARMLILKAHMCIK